MPPCEAARRFVPTVYSHTGFRLRARKSRRSFYETLRGVFSDFS